LGEQGAPARFLGGGARVRRSVIISVARFAQQFGGIEHLQSWVYLGDLLHIRWLQIGCNEHIQDIWLCLIFQSLVVDLYG